MSDSDVGAASLMSGETTRRVLRYTVPVDDQWHTLDVDGEIVHVGSKHATQVDFWAITSGEPCPRSFIVCGTGQALPENTFYRGTVAVLGGQLVWHLFERAAVVGGGQHG